MPTTIRGTGSEALVPGSREAEPRRDLPQPAGTYLRSPTVLERAKEQAERARLPSDTEVARFRAMLAVARGEGPSTTGELWGPDGLSFSL